VLHGRCQRRDIANAPIQRDDPGCSRLCPGFEWKLLGSGCTGVSFSAAPTSVTVSATVGPVDALSPTAQETLSQVSTDLGFGPSGLPATAIFASAGGTIPGTPLAGGGQVTYIPGNNNVCMGVSGGLSTPPGVSISGGGINSAQNVDVTNVVQGPSGTLSVIPGFAGGSFVYSGGNVASGPQVGTPGVSLMYGPSACNTPSGWLVQPVQDFINTITNGVWHLYHP
jgi:hypothetical protein